MTGTVYGLGVGPGDPELVTLKAVAIARRVPVLAFPAPEDGDSLARSIMAPHLHGGQIEIVIRMTLSAERYPSTPAFDAAADAIADHAAAGRDVAVLCLGDPFFYGSFMYLFARLAERARVAIVPGVTSIAAATAALGFPLAARGDAFGVVPALLPDHEIERRLATLDSAAILKLGRHFGRVRRLLERLDLAQHARYVERASFADQRIAALDAVDGNTAPYFSLILLHKRGRAA